MADPFLKMAEYKGNNNFLDIRILFEKNLVPPGFEPGAPDPKSGVLTS